MKKAKRKKSKTTKAIRSAKSAARKTGAESSGSQGRQPALLAWLERLGADPKPHLVLLAPRQLPEPDARCSDRGAAS